MRKTTALIATAVLLFVASACGDDSDLASELASPSPTTSASAPPTTAPTTAAQPAAPAPAQPAAPNPDVTNGGFEEPVAPTGRYTLIDQGKTIPGWKVVGAPGNIGPVSGTYTYDGFAFPPHGGKQSLDLTGRSNTATGVEQAFSTRPGVSYVLNFWVGNINDPQPQRQFYFGKTSNVGVFIDGSKVMTASNSDGAGAQKLVWKEFSKTFTATSQTTTVRFMNEDPSNDNNNGLDDVALRVS